MTAQATSRPGLPARLGRQLVAVVGAVRALVAVLAVGMVVGAFAVPDKPAEAQPEYAALSAADPIKLQAHRLHISAPVVPIPITDGALDPPRNAKEVGWWSQSAQPGAVDGQTVITGHTVHTGGGSLNNLGRLRAGDKVDVISKRGRMRYQVTKIRTYSKADVARYAKALFGQDRGRGRLILVTCTDWNGHGYDSNIVAFGKPLGKPLLADDAATAKKKQKAAAGS